MVVRRKDFLHLVARGLTYETFVCLFKDGFGACQHSAKTSPALCKNCRRGHGTLPTDVISKAIIVTNFQFQQNSGCTPFQASSGAWCCALESTSFSDLSRFCWALLRRHVPDYWRGSAPCVLDGLSSS